MNREIREKRENILFKDECYNIQGAVFDVYKEMGCGFLEAVYQECLEKEFINRNIPFQAQNPLIISYKGEQLSQKYVPDFICYSKIIVEIKAVKTVAQEHQAQLLNYLKATELELGLLVNFGSYPKVQVIRMANMQFSRLSRLNNKEELTAKNANTAKDELEEQINIDDDFSRVSCVSRLNNELEDNSHEQTQI